MRRSILVTVVLALALSHHPAGAQGLTPSEAAEVAASARARNLFHCNNGLYGCDRSRLTPSEQEEVAVSARARNLFNCNNGLYGCDRSRLAASEQEEVAVSARARNLFNCNNGLYGCDARALSGPEAKKVAAPARARSLPSCDHRLHGCDRASLTAADKVSASKPESVGDQSTVPEACAENGSCYGDLSTATGRPKTVHVNGYFRKDGTYVRGYYRSPPRSGSGRRR